MSLASQEELTEVINFLSGAPIKLRLLSDDDTNPSMAESHMTPVDSGLGSIFSMALSNITQPSSAPTCACEKIDNKESHEVTPFRNQSESKERATTPDVHSIKGAMATVTIETQTSPSAELCPVLLVKSADSDSEERQCGHQSPAENDEQQNQPSNKEDENDDRIPSPVLTENDGNPDNESQINDDDDDENSGTPRPVSPSQTKQDTTDVHAESSDSVPNAETPKLSVENEEQTKSSKTPSPVFVTVSSEECDDDKTLSISESLR